MASKEAVAVAQLRGTNTAKVSPGTGTLRLPLRSLSLEEEECESHLGYDFSVNQQGT